jgi:hypothetical protein
MWELRTLELLIALFLFLPLIRPFFKRLWTLDGLTALPLLALGIGVGIFPAYGIRPECFPLILYAIIMNIANFPALGAVLRQLKNDNFRDRGIIGSGVLLALLIAATASALCFAPSTDIAITGARSATVRDKVRNAELFLRVYAPELPPGAETAEKRPLMLLVPPAAGSLLTVDRLCGELSRRGFTTLAYSRRGIDAPALQTDGKRRLLSPIKSLQRLQALFQGTWWASANAIGRSLEAERRQDLAFLLSSLQNRAESESGRAIAALLGANTDSDVIFIAGYGAGGAAAVILSAEPDFAERNPAVRGIIGLESPILSAMAQVPAPQPEPGNGQTGWLRSFQAYLGGKIARLIPQKVRGVDRVPQPEVPALFILSDRALSSSRSREQRYLSVLETYRRAVKPAALVMARGAGPLDYSDVPEKYPLLSRLFPGTTAPLWTREEYLTGTVSLIANFCAALLEGEAIQRMAAIQRTALDRAIYIETNRAWNLAAAEYILGL